MIDEFMKGMGFDPERYIKARVEEFRQTFVITRGDDSGNISTELEETLVAIEEGLRQSLPEATAKLSALYAKHFTKDEMEALITFWKSDVYKKTSAIQESLNEDQGIIMGEWNTAAYNHAEPQMKKALDAAPEEVPVGRPPDDASMLPFKSGNVRVIEMPPSPDPNYLTGDEIIALSRMGDEDDDEVIAGEEPPKSA
jgi:hypothetical protein